MCRRPEAAVASKPLPILDLPQVPWHAFFSATPHVLRSLSTMANNRFSTNMSMKPPESPDRKSLPLRRASQLIVVAGILWIVGFLAYNFQWQRFCDQQSGQVETRFGWRGLVVWRTSESNSTTEFIRSRLLRSWNPQWKGCSLTQHFGVDITKHADEKGPVYEYVDWFLTPGIRFQLVRNVDEAVAAGRAFIDQPNLRTEIFIATQNEWLERAEKNPAAIAAEYFHFLGTLSTSTADREKATAIMRVRRELFPIDNR